MKEDKNIPTSTEADDETVASQEEIYLEETEEEIRAILISDDPGSSQTTAEYWRITREEQEVDWEVESHDRRSQQPPHGKESR